MKRLRLLCVMLLAVFASPSVRAEKALYPAGSRNPISLAQMVGELKGARVIVFGEQHDNPAQRTLLQALRDSGANLAIGMEMLQASDQPHLDAWIGGELDEKSFAELFAVSWGAEYYPFYREILYYARQEGIPLVGLNIQRETVSRVNGEGYNGLSREEKEKIGVLVCDVDPLYKSLLANALGPERPSSDRFERFCEAQVLWDTIMAKNSVAYLSKNPRRVLILFAGNYHAWKPGIPTQLSRLSKLPVTVVLPVHEKDMAKNELLRPQTDYLWLIK